MIKNNDLRTFLEFSIEDGFSVLIFENDLDQLILKNKQINSSFIQFHFCLKGQADFIFNEGNYSFSVHESNSILLYNPKKFFQSI